MSKSELPVHAVILAGGRGTRFWPRSRIRTPKQLLNIVGKTTMLEQTVARLRPLIPAKRIWTVTNSEQAASVRRLLPAAARPNVISEPVGRNTAAAIGLAALHVRRAAGGDAVLAVLPADHFIADAERYRRIVRAALTLARQAGRMIVLGIPPAYPETGFGYVERMGDPTGAGDFPAYRVRRFTEKPDRKTAEGFLSSGNYHWNAGMFFWRVSTFLENLQRYLPGTFVALEKLSAQIGRRGYGRALAAIYRKLENISVDYAIVEKAAAQQGDSAVYVIPAQVGWSDIGSWAAVYDLLAAGPGDTVSAGPHVALDAEGNFLWSPGKLVAAIGVKNLIVVETPDALLICPRDRAQNVGQVVQWLQERKRRDLL